MHVQLYSVQLYIVQYTLNAKPMTAQGTHGAGSQYKVTLDQYKEGKQHR